MAQLSNSSSTPYCTAAQMLLCYAYTLVADLLVPTESNNPPPSYLAILDATNPAGIRLAYHLSVGAGEIEAACAVQKRYTPDDLNALTGVSQTMLQKLNAARAFWSLANSMRPLTARVEEVPYAVESLKMLEELRDGTKLFTFEESQDAGVGPTVNPPNPYKLVTPNAVARAYRLFPNSPLDSYRRGE